MTSKPRRLSLVKFVPPPAVGGRKAARYPFKKGETCLFLGDIPNLPGHCAIVALKTGKIHAGYHTELFVELSAHEV